MIIGSKNKGDWSELYVLLYLLGSRKLYTADEQLNRVGEYYFPINKMFRQDVADEKIDFVLDGIDSVKIYFNSELSREMTSKEFADEATELYRDIVSGRGSFDIPHTEEFINSVGLKRLATPSTDIADIKIELHDTSTGIDQTMGFSIKSYIGEVPTLLNASTATNFKYEVSDISDTQMKEINSIETRTKIVDRMNAITKSGKMRYVRTINSVFAGNLMMIDSRMEELIAEMLKYSYCNNKLDCKGIIEHLEEKNPLSFPRSGMYSYKLKQFLCAKALGMEPSTEWSGDDKANGGYIVAKTDGDVLAYHLYNRDKFKQYLLDSTKLERGSTTRHNYAYLYKEGDKMFIDLNLQIRFK